MTASSLRRLAMLAVAAALTVVPPAGSPDEGEGFGPETYWYLEKRGLLLEQSVQDGTLSGWYRSRHGRTPFRIEKDLLDAPGSKRAGYLRALEDLVSIVTYASGSGAIAEARDRLRELTGLDLAAGAWEPWLQAHREDLQWDARQERFFVGQ